MTPQTGRFADLYRRLYRLEPTGGPLHTVLDDCNIYDEDLRTPDYSYLDTEPYDVRHPEEDRRFVREACDEILQILRDMTVPQRLTAFAYADRLLPPIVGVGHRHAYELTCYGDVYAIVRGTPDEALREAEMHMIHGCSRGVMPWANPEWVWSDGVDPRHPELGQTVQPGWSATDSGWLNHHVLLAAAPGAADVDEPGEAAGDAALSGEVWRC